MKTIQKNKSLLLVALCCAVCAALGFGVAQLQTLPGSAATGSPEAAAPKPNPEPEIVLAAQARIEGSDETIKVGAGSDGVLAAVQVREGQHVRADDLVAVIACDDVRAEMAAAQAAIEVAIRRRERLVRGSRDEQRQRIRSEIPGYEAELKATEAQWRRTSQLTTDGVLSQAELDVATRNYEVAQAALRAKRDEVALINADPLPEELAQAEAEIRSAQERYRFSTARLEKCQVRAPIAGTILRLHKKVGESVSVLLPQPILEISDTTQLRVRAEVDERDLHRLQLGQRARIQIDAFPQQRFTARLISFGQVMGRKQVKSGDPAEKSDRDVLEVLLDLDSTSVRPPIGLRVTAQFLR